VALTLLSPGGAYETAVLAANPVAFYLFNETGDPATNAPAFDSVGGFSGTYGAGVANGNAAYNVQGPVSADGFPGLGAGNKAAQFTHLTGTSRVTVQPWNLNTNTVSLTAWINPAGSQDSADAVVFCRGAGTVAGLNYTANTDVNGNYTLGYTWDNEYDTYNWDSGLVAPVGQWSFVALVVTPTNATIHVMNANGLVSSTHAYKHVPQSFGGTPLIGDDSNDGGNGARVFNGAIDNVAIFSSALSKSQLATIFSAGSGVINYPPLIGAQPASQALYAQQTARFTVSSGGTDPLSYQWQAGTPGSGVFTNLINGGRISGSQTPTLSVATVQSGGVDDADFIVTITNNYGAVTSRVASLSVMPVGVAEAITLSVQEPVGNDWDTPGMWSDGNPASLSAIGRPGSTYEVLAGGRVRTPINPNFATFPGDVLTISGNGVYANSPPVGSVIGELRLKQPIPGAVNFKRLVMNGGQIDAANPGVCIIGGEMDILTNTPIYNDSATDGARSIQIDAQLSGSGTIEYHGYAAAFNPTFTNSLNVTGTSNTFTGQLNVVAGTLLGTGHNALGTGNLTVNTNGTLETAYDMISSNATLVVNGRMYLHQNDTFQNVVIGGVGLAQGTYSLAQLNAAYPTNFPASWPLQTGSTVSNGSGSITVAGGSPIILNQPASQTLYEQQTAQFTVLAGGSSPVSYQWWKGTSGVFAQLADGGQISGSTTPGLTISNLVAANAADYIFIATNAYGAVTSIVATLTVLPMGPAEHITLSAIQPDQPPPVDWDTINWWSDTLPASQSAVGKPSTYEVLAGGLLRTPKDAATATFPGIQLTISGDGVWSQQAASGTIGELRLKPVWNGGTVTFKQLVMNGGQIDIAMGLSAGQSGASSFLAGEVDILTNTGTTAAYTYSRPGTYTVGLIVNGAGGSATNTQVDYIVVASPPQVALQFGFSGSSLQLSWPQGTLLEATNVTGLWTTNTHASPLTVTPNEPRKFYRVLVQ
jgi:hypothetical protein